MFWQKIVCDEELGWAAEEKKRRNRLEELGGGIRPEYRNKLLTCPGCGRLYHRNTKEVLDKFSRAEYESARRGGYICINCEVEKENHKFRIKKILDKLGPKLGITDAELSLLLKDLNEELRGK